MGGTGQLPVAALPWQPVTQKICLTLDHRSGAQKQNRHCKKTNFTRSEGNGKAVNFDEGKIKQMSLHNKLTKILCKVTITLNSCRALLISDFVAIFKLQISFFLLQVSSSNKLLNVFYHRPTCHLTN